MKKAAAITLGCKVNQYDTQAMMELLEQDGYEIVPFHSKADVYIVNTCTVTNTADKKSRQAISRAAAENPDAVICVAGCLAQRAGEDLLCMKNVSAVLGTSDRMDIVRIVKEAKSGKVNAVKADNTVFEEMSIRSSGEMTRGYVKIQEGCNQYCAYCIIPYVRGPARSRSLAGILKEARGLAESGVREIVLTGINISSYNTQKGERLADLLEELDQLQGLARIRLGSLEPGLFTPEFLSRAVRVTKLCPHFHVSLQSGSDRVLARMSRTYKTQEYAKVIGDIRKIFNRPAITTDVITGFPGETKEEFLETFDFLRKIRFARLHVFPYSERTGTAAATLPGKLPLSIRKQRANILIAQGKESETAYIKSFLGQKENVLFERIAPEGLAEGHTERYLRVRAPGRPNELAAVLLKSQKNGILFGEAVKGG
jgi:threonylcarbamoyladenosine tRNA methylthiotransferase MtaB